MMRVNPDFGERYTSIQIQPWKGQDYGIEFS